MIIQHNIMALNSHRQLGINNSNLQRNLEKLSSGYRINKAADDAAGLAISEKMRAQITGLNRAVLNAKDASSLVQTAEGGLTEMHTMLNRMVELATESANGVYDDATDRENIQKELESLSEEIDRISKATNFNGIALLDGNFRLGKEFQIGDTGQSFNKITVFIVDMQASELKVKAGSATTASEICFETQEDAAKALTQIKDAINNVSTQRGQLGAIQNRLEHVVNNLGVTSENMTDAESRIRDVDMAQEMMHFTKNNVLAQAAQAMLAQASQQPQQVLQLLR